MRILPCCLLVVALVGCSAEAREEQTIVASVYPLAFVAERIAGTSWEVVDLTPPGTEAHDLELTLEDRAALEAATAVLYLGDIGFQPQLEDAIVNPESEVAGAAILVGSPRRDPHWWLDPSSFTAAVDFVQGILVRKDPDRSADYDSRALQMTFELDELHAQFSQELSDCRYSTAIVTHEAFGYLADRYGFEQFGLTGITPEAEPTAARLSRANALIEDGEAGAVFYEREDNAHRTAESFAADAGVLALPLGTLESRPLEGDYFSVMQENLASLRKGLQCR